MVSGSSADTLLLQVASNTDFIVATQLKPEADGTITITASPGPENDNSYGFFYLGVMKVIYEAEPSTQTPQLSLLWPNGGEYWQVGKSPVIAWKSQNVGSMTIEYTYDGGQVWQVIDTVFAAQQSYAWQVPPTPSQQCLVRLSADTVSVVSNDFFEIADDTTICRIAVIGSSTAAGAGASVPDSAWVNRYRTQVFQNNTRVEVANLAKGGYTTYHLLPTGTPIPPGISITIDEERNISKALSLEPYAVIVNLPSNDAANLFPAADQLTNFAAMQAAADSAGVELYICTTQPRNFSNPAQVAIQKEVRDSILSIYSDHALDFWTPIADSNGYILSQYNSGDGVHLNDAGHRLLAETVLEKGIHQTDCAPIINNTAGVKPEEPKVVVYPNPFGEEVNVNLILTEASDLEIKLFDLVGNTLVNRSELHVPANKPTSLKLNTLPDQYRGF
ncbi:MAG: SGNH/GDSL hydrolase family protein, partial [Gammaproteobacteria bacterium]